MAIKHQEDRVEALKKKRHFQALNDDEALELVTLCKAQFRAGGPGGDPSSIGRPKLKSRRSTR